MAGAVAPLPVAAAFVMFVVRGAGPRWPKPTCIPRTRSASIGRLEDRDRARATFGAMSSRPPPTPVRWLRNFVRIIRVHGDSMEPTLADGDRLLAVRPGPWRPLRCGSIVVGRVPARAGGDGSALFIKRVLALPGEVARVRGDELTSVDAAVDVFGGRLDGTHVVWPVPAGHVFVRGDGRNSADSTSWGPVPRADVTRVVVLRLLRRERQDSEDRS